MSTDKAPIKAVYVIRNIPNGDKHWLRIGVAFVNRDGSLNVKLGALPIDGELHIREFPEPRQEDIHEQAS